MENSDWRELETSSAAARRLIGVMDARKNTVAERRQCPAQIQETRPCRRWSGAGDDSRVYVARSGRVVAANEDNRLHVYTIISATKGTDTGHDATAIHMR